MAYQIGGSQSQWLCPAHGSRVSDEGFGQEIDLAGTSLRIFLRSGQDSTMGGRTTLVII